MSASERLIVALDFTQLAPALAMARQLRGLVRTVKVGSVLFTASGPAAIQRLRALGFEIMLDLKFLDIPSTVEGSCRAAVGHRISMLTIHAGAEPPILHAAVRGVRLEAAHRGVTRPLVLGVTVLTSVGDGTSSVLSRRVVMLAQRAVDAGCDGVVASAQDAVTLRRRFGRSVRIVCPGIRPARTGHADQRRVCTPADALARGADLLVVGRPITEARHPRQAAQQILADMETVARC